MLIAKLLFCSTLAFGSLLVLRWLQGRAGEERILRALVIAITIAPTDRHTATNGTSTYVKSGE